MELMVLIMKKIEVIKVVEFLNLHGINYEFYGDSNSSYSFNIDRLLETFNYSYKSSEWNNRCSLLFTEIKKESDIDQFIVENPKFVLYHFLFANFDEKTLKYIKKTYNESDFGSNNNLGTEPFSFYNFNNVEYKAKSFGGLIIAKNVHIGSNNSISKGIFSDTEISSNCKIDSNVYIAHDCNIGKDTIITSGVSIGGFVSIGHSCYIGLNACIKNNVSIGNNVQVGMGSVVTHSFGDDLVIYGNPAKIISHKCKCGRINKIKDYKNSYSCECMTKYKIEKYKVFKLGKEKT